MDTTLLFILIWLAVGLIAVTTDLIRNKETYIGSNLFIQILYVLAYIVAGGFTMGIVIYELTEGEKK